MIVAIIASKISIHIKLNFIMRSQQFHIILFLLIIFPFTVSAVDIVRMNIQIGAYQSKLDLELYDTTPITRDNFLSYVGNNRYDNSFIHRSVTDFVIQGGGYIYDAASGGFDYDSATDTYPGGLKEILQDAPIINEFAESGLFNVRGTIAMARTNDPDSATSQWFINQVDNTFLDDGFGYTVFGRVLDDGMSVVDLIGALPISNQSSIHAAFAELPLDNYVTGALVVQDNLVRVNSVMAIQRPILKSDSDPIDFPLVQIGLAAQKTIILSNIGNADLVMDAASLAALVAPFSITAETCSNATLRPVTPTILDSCSVTIVFTPPTPGSYQSNLVITPSVNPLSIVPSLTITGTGEVIPTTPVLTEQNNITLLDFSNVTVNTISTAKTIAIQNRGEQPLDLTVISVSGLDAGLFSTDTIGCKATTTLLTGETCTLTINFAPVSEGQKLALLTIDSNGGSLLIDLAGNGAVPAMELTSQSLDFGTIQPGESVTDSFGILNYGLGDLEITSLMITGTDIADFTQINSCPSVHTTATPESMGTGKVCGIFVTFNPATIGIKSATLTITTTDPNNSVVDLSLVGAAGLADIDALQQVDVGAAQTSLTPAYKEITITNLGGALLNFSTVTITGVDSSSYSVQHDCPGTSTTTGGLLPLGQNETCTIAVQFSPLTNGVHNASLEIASNDPDEPLFIINLTGRGELDIDGITDAEEQNAPNNGDANNDMVQDNVQNNVASFLTNMDVYATIVSAPGTLLYDVSVSSNPSPGNMPGSADFKHGIFQYNIGVLDSSVTVGIFMSADDTSNTYYKYGPTPDNQTPHWYDFSYDGLTGAEYLGKVTIENPVDGSIVSRSMFRLTYIDGQRGDDDLTVNGQIATVGGLSTVATSSSVSGSMSWYLILLSSIFLMRLCLNGSTIEIK